MNDFSIDRRSKIPYDKQLQLILRSMISMGILRKGEPLQNSEELAVELGIEPAQVIKAYRLLEKEKRVTYQNESWMVSTGNVPRTFFDDYFTIYDSIRRNLKVEPSIKTLELETKKKVKGYIAESLKTTSALYTKRVYYGDELPYVLVYTYFPENRFPGFENELAKSQPYFRFMEHTYGIKLTQSTRIMNGVNLKKSDAFLLGVPEGAAAYHTIVENYDNDTVYEVMEVYGISEIMHFSLQQKE